MSNKRIIKQLNSMEKFKLYSKCSSEYEKVSKNKTLKSLLYNLNHPKSFKKQSFLNELARKYPYKDDIICPNKNLLSVLQTTENYFLPEKREELSNDKKSRNDSYNYIFNLTRERIKKKKKELLSDSISYNPKYNVIDKNIPSVRMFNPSYKDEIIKSKKIFDLSQEKKISKKYFKENRVTLGNNIKYKSFKIFKKINNKNEKDKIIKNINEIEEISHKRQIKFKSKSNLNCNTDRLHINKIASDLFENKYIKIKINDNIKNISNKIENQKTSEINVHNLFTNNNYDSIKKESNDDLDNKIFNDDIINKEKKIFNLNSKLNYYLRKKNKKHKKIEIKKSEKYDRHHDKDNIVNFSKMTPREENAILNDNLLNNPSSTYYTPKYNFVYETAKATSFGNRKKTNLSHKKYLMKKLWGSYSNIGQNYYIVDNNKLPSS